MFLSILLPRYWFSSLLPITYDKFWAVNFFKIISLQRKSRTVMSSLVSLWVFSLWKAARFLWSRRFDLGMNRKESFDSFEKTEEDHSDLFTNTHSTLVFYYIHGTRFRLLIYGACYSGAHKECKKQSKDTVCQFYALVTWEIVIPRLLIFTFIIWSSKKCQQS